MAVGADHTQAHCPLADRLAVVGAGVGGLGVGAQVFLAQQEPTVEERENTLRTLVMTDMMSRL